MSAPTRQRVPQNLDAEKGVVSSVLCNPTFAFEHCASVNEFYFSDPRNAALFVWLREAWNDGVLPVGNAGAVDEIALCDLLETQGRLTEFGGRIYINHLGSFLPTAAAIDYHVEILKDKYVLRRLLDLGTKTVKATQSFNGGDVDVLLSDIESQVLAIRPPIRKETFSMRQLIPVAIEQIERAYETKGAMTGMSTGFVELDRMTGGAHGGDMTVIAGRPSMGKTALAMNIAEHVALNEKKAVMVYSAEMSASQLVQRLICSRARVNLMKLRDGFLSERDFPALTAAASKLSDAPIFVNEDSAATVETICSNARLMRREKKIELIVIDYLQLLNSSAKHHNRQAEMTTISARIKKLAKELHVPVIALCQLNRKPEERGGRPRLSDLRESGSLEQDADNVFLLYRKEIYEEDEEARHEMAGEAELIIAKQRNGPVGEVSLTFLKEFTRFEDRARMSTEQEPPPENKTHHAKHRKQPATSNHSHNP